MPADVWKRLGIPPTKDKKLIKRAFKYLKSKAETQREIWLIEEDYRQAIRMAEDTDYDIDRAVSGYKPGDHDFSRFDDGGFSIMGAMGSCLSGVLMVGIFALVILLKSGALFDIFESGGEFDPELADESDQEMRHIVREIERYGSELVAGIMMEHYVLTVSALQKGEDPATTFDEIPIFLWSVSLNEVKFQTILLEYGADGFVLDQNGNNALHYAVFRGSAPHVAYLLDSGLNPNHKNKSGLTPEMIARRDGHTHLLPFFAEEPASEEN